MTRLTPTPSQTLGPFFAHGLLRPNDGNLAGPDAMGERIVLRGILRDHEGAGVRDALIELWQADAKGRYPGRDADADPAVNGFGRTMTGADGSFEFATVMPGAAAGTGNKRQAPHFLIGVFAAGLSRRVTTRIYAPDAGALADDEVFGELPPATRERIVAKASGAGRLEFEINLGGARATPAFSD